MSVKYKKIVASVSLSLFMLALAGCGSLAVNSLRKDKEITIDARSNEWASGTYIKEADCSFYARNDSENLYICLISANRDLGYRIMQNGLSLWIESDKEKANRFGIRFPIPPGKSQGIAEAGSRQLTGISGSTSNSSRNMNHEEDMPFPVLPEEYELISKDGQLEGRYGFSEGSGILIKTGIFQGRLIYEMKLPLKAKNAAMGEVAADAGSIIKLNFTLNNILTRREKETGRDREYDVRGQVGMPEGETMEDGQGYTNGRGGRINSQQSVQTGKNFDLKIDLTLSSEGGK